jgi:hypothetical protein
MSQEPPLCRQPYQQDIAQDGDADNHSQDVDGERQGVIQFHHASMERACYRADPHRRGAAPMADPGELNVSCLDCHHNTTMPVGGPAAPL